MAAVAVAGRVGVVLEQVDRAADALFAQSLLGRHEQALEDPLAGLVVHDEVVQRVAFRRRVLGMRADVEVQPGAVLQEHVAAAAPRHHAAEQVAGDLVGAQPPLTAQRTGDAVLVLEPVDAALHVRNVARLRTGLLVYPPLCRNRNVVPGRACATEGTCVGGHDGDHRVATGHRMIGQHHDRLPVGRHLDRPFDQALAEQLTDRDPLQRRAAEAGTDTVSGRADDERLRRRGGVQASLVNQSRRGPSERWISVVRGG